MEVLVQVRKKMWGTNTPHENREYLFQEKDLLNVDIILLYRYKHDFLPVSDKAVPYLLYN